jgi:serine/threonine-protein kinase PknK
MLAASGLGGCGGGSAAVAPGPAQPWAARAPMLLPRYLFGASAVNSRVYAVGGLGKSDNSGGPFANDVEVYDPSTNTWTVDGPFPSPRSAFGVAAIGNVLYAVGGGLLLGGVVNTVEAYDTSAHVWTAKRSMNTSRVRLGVVAINNIVYAVGGVHFTGPEGPDVLALVEAYDPAANKWTTMPSMPAPRYGLAVAVVGNVAYAMAGDFNGPVIDTVDAFTP